MLTMSRMTPEQVHERLKEALWTLRRLPNNDRPRGYRSAWPDYVQEPGQLRDLDRKTSVRSEPPSHAEIDRLLEVMRWMTLVPRKRDQVLLIDKAKGLSSDSLVGKYRVQRSTVFRWWKRALAELAKAI